MAWVAVIGAVGTVGGAMMGGRKGATDQSTSNTKSMDPTVRKWYFGEDGNGGLLGDLNKWYSENKSGLNPDMTAGLGHMRSVYQSPLATQGYERMGNAGYDLMGRGVAGNPFVTGQMPNFGYLQGQQQAQFQPPQMPQFTRAGQYPVNQPAQPGQPGIPTPITTPQQVEAPPTSNLGLSQPLSLSDNWVKPVAPTAPAATAAPFAPTAPTMDADTFRKLYEEEMKRRDAAWWGDASNNPTAGFGA